VTRAQLLLCKLKDLGCQLAIGLHIGPWNSGIQDQPALMQAAGFSQIETGEIETGTTRLPEIGFALGRISQAAAER
jgi:hypothetical protein